jgi:hypothetical protein
LVLIIIKRRGRGPGCLRSCALHAAFWILVVANSDLPRYFPDQNFSFFRLAPRVLRPHRYRYAGAPVYDMSLTHAQRLCAVGPACEFRCNSLGVGHQWTLAVCQGVPACCYLGNRLAGYGCMRRDRWSWRAIRHWQSARCHKEFPPLASAHRLKPCGCFARCTLRCDVRLPR